MPRKGSGANKLFDTRRKELEGTARRTQDPRPRRALSPPDLDDEVAGRAEAVDKKTRGDLSLPTAAKA